MSVLRLHGFVPPNTPAGRDAPEHLRIDLGRLVALATVGPAARAHRDASVDETLALGAVHHALLCASIGAGDVLPVRPGAAFSGEEALRQAVSDRVPGYVERLGLLAGKVEFAVQARKTLALPTRGWSGKGRAEASRHAADPHKAAASSGRGFLAARRDQRAARTSQVSDRRRFVAHLATDLDLHAEAQTPLTPSAPEVLSHTAFLVLRSEVASFMAALTTHVAPGEALGLDLLVMGPLPPYAFTGEGQAVPMTEAAHA